VTNLSILPTIAGVSMSFAGFAGLFLALRPKDTEWSSREVGQLKSIVTFALTALFCALLVVPGSSLIGEASAIRLISGIALVFEFYGHQIRVGTAWSRWSRLERLPRRELLLTGIPFVVVAIVEQLLLLANVIQPSVELFELAVIAILATPALVFPLVVSRIAAGRR
jgi:hypothetical protein